MTSETHKISQKKAVKEHFSKKTDIWYKLYNANSVEDRFLYNEYRRRKEIVFSFLPSNGIKSTYKAIDVGCGAGHYVSDLIRDGFFTFGSDVSRKMIEVTRTNIKSENSTNKKLLCADCEFLPFPNNYFDVIICVGVLSYVSNEQSVLKELSRVVKQDGTIIVNFPNLFKLRNVLDPYYYVVRIWKYFGKKLAGLLSSKKPVVKVLNPKNYFYENRYTLKQVKRLIKQSGLTKITIKGYGFGPLRFWRKEILPLKLSLKISGFLELIQNLKLFRFLNTFASAWIVSLKNS